MSRTPRTSTSTSTSTSTGTDAPKSRPGKPGKTPAATPPRLRRLLHQDKNDPWAVKLLPRIVFGIAAAYTLFTLASQSGSSFVAVGTLIVLGLVVWLLRHRVQLLLALASTTVTAALTGYLSAAGDAARWNTGTAVSGQAVFGYWALTGMALLGAWMVKNHPGRRGITVVLADVILVIASVVGMFLPEAGVPVGFLGVITVLALRGDRVKAVMSRLTARLRPALDRRRPRKATDPTDS
ncbi:hypothetical protein SAMN04487983_100732 [Streptomyces sp. yr375]|uniref:hypothetical protein n=1 Tax=Streptomyces sp. yr375 TaxID=1761906 RepID=UPI0008C9367B|nr:hypothetical protein [Streptomyces sp. yr375]SEQ66832.1 hypothetical protein SAMN04487983_100732 [Streptomyces sp. yr375]